MFFNNKSVNSLDIYFPQCKSAVSMFESSSGGEITLRMPWLTDMAEFYAHRIMSGKLELEQVPAQLIEKVISILIERGYEVGVPEDAIRL